MGKKKELISQLRSELKFASLQIANLNKQNKSLENENSYLKREINDGLGKIVTSEKLIIVRKNYLLEEAHKLIKLLQQRLDKITASNN